VAYILYWNVPDALSFTLVYSKRCRLETRLRRDRGLIDTRETKRSSDALPYVPHLRGPSILDSAARYRDIGQDGRLAERYPSLAPSPFTLEEPSSDRNKRRNAGHISDGVTSVRQVFEIRKTAESREKIDAGCAESVRAACRDSSRERERERERAEFRRRNAENVSAVPPSADYKAMTSRRIVTRAIYAREAASSRADLIGRHTLLDRLISRHARVHLDKHQR